MSKEGVLGFSISYLVLEIFKLLTYESEICNLLYPLNCSRAKNLDKE